MELFTEEFSIVHKTIYVKKFNLGVNGSSSGISTDRIVYCNDRIFDRNHILYNEKAQRFQSVNIFDWFDISNNLGFIVHFAYSCGYMAN